MKRGWQTKTLDELCEISRGGSPRPIKAFLTDDADGINWIKISDATASIKYIYKTMQKIKPEGVKRSRLVHDGDFLLSNSMSFGRPYIMRTSGCIHDGWLVLSDKSGLFDQDYLYYFIGSPEAYRQFDDRASGSTVRNLNIDLVRSVEVSLPSLPEQKRIVAILDEAFEGIDKATANTEKNLANARELFESYLNNVFSQKCEGWVERSLSDLCSITSKLVDPREPEYIDLSHIGAGNMVSMTGELIEIKTAREEALTSGKFVFDDRMVLYSKIRPYLMKACRPDFTGLCSADVYPLFPSVGLLDRDFLYHLLMSRHFTDYAIAGSDRAGMPKINRGHLFHYCVHLPGISQQKRLATKFDKLSDEAKSLKSIYQQKLTDLTELKQSILQKAFSGELTEAIVTSNVISSPKTILGITTTDLHAGVLAMAYQLHEGNAKYEQNFGHVKAEKIAHMVEAYVGIDFGRVPVKDAAGPNDFRHLKQVEHRARKAGYFNFKQSSGDKYFVEKYRRFNEIIEKTHKALGEDNIAVDRILKIMLPMDTKQAEVFATVFAAWNNLLIRNEDVSNEAIVYEARENWHKDKLRIPRPKFFKAIEWMKKNNIIPKGKGKLVAEKAKK